MTIGGIPYQDWTPCEVHGHCWEIGGDETEYCTDCGAPRCND